MPETTKIYVLVGEHAGDYDDFYQRYRDPIACSESKKDLEIYRDSLTDHEYVEFVIEEMVRLKLTCHIDCEVVHNIECPNGTPMKHESERPDNIDDVPHPRDS
ncbi:hypothetical protein KAR91_54895 [Candidatus Pacearchaeota archaeon]|nr:hypothetical protein [Candidatus Pacearchaeota archaeon]